MVHRQSQVCNHPELFERADVVAPFSFSKFGRSGPLVRESDFVPLPYSTRNPIEFWIPALFYEDGGLLHVPCENSTPASGSSLLSKTFNIWSTDWMSHSVQASRKFTPTCSSVYFQRRLASSSFSFLRALDMSPREAHSLYVSPLIRRRLLAVEEEVKDLGASAYPL